MPLPSITGGAITSASSQSTGTPIRSESAKVSAPISTPNTDTNVINRKASVSTPKTESLSKSVPDSNQAVSNRKASVTAPAPTNRKASVTTAAANRKASVTTPTNRKSSVAPATGEKEEKRTDSLVAAVLSSSIKRTKRMLSKVDVRRRVGINLGAHKEMEKSIHSVLEDLEDGDEKEQLKFEETINNMSQLEYSEYLLKVNTDISDKDASLAMPLGLKYPVLPKVGEYNYSDSVKVSVDKNVDSRLSGLPGNLSMSISETNTYFGSNGRFNFYERYQWLLKQRDITCKTATESTSSLRYNIQDKNHDPVYQEHGFSPTRQNKLLFDRSGKWSSPSSLSQQMDNLMLSANMNKSGMDGTVESVDDDIFDASFTPNFTGNTSNNTLRRDSDVTDSTNIGTVEQFLSSLTNSDELDYPHTPRTTYIDACISSNMTPKANVVVRKELSKCLDLRHLGIGNDYANALVTSLVNLPYIEAVNLEDNRLDDESLGPIVSTIATTPGIIEINLSNNELGPNTASALSNYLQSSNCTLERLILSAADVDDFECERFISAIANNRSVKQLMMSKNLIGASENLNTVYPDLTTGSEAIANLLRSKTCMLESLSLDWNMIRLDGAIDLASSVGENTSLTYLDISYNALGFDGGVALGVALNDNNTLTYLNIGSNNLTAIPCFTICSAILENRSLKNVYFDGNPIGEEGAKAVMMIPMHIGTRTVVSAKDCNITMKDPKFWFDFDKPISEYNLNLTDGYERAIALLLLNIVVSHPTYEFETVEYIEKPNSKPVKIELVPAVSYEKMEHFTATQRKTYESLLKIEAASSDIKEAVRLFQETDEDGSGELDKDEIENLLKKMGLDITQERLDEIFYLYDVDGGGTVELAEFLTFLRTQAVEAKARAHDLASAPIFVPKDQNHLRKYKPPLTGVLRMKVIDAFVQKLVFRTMSSADKDCIKHVASNVKESALMIFHGIENAKLRLDEAISLFKTLILDMNDPIALACKLLPQIASANDARQFINNALGGNRIEMLKLKRAMGFALKPILGHPNGYYILDMTKHMDRICLNKLIEISKNVNTIRKNKCALAPNVGITGDYSQLGNWSCFRNEMLNSKPVTIDAEFATPLPRAGRVEFDFIGTTRPPKDALVANDQRVLKILLSHYLLEENEVPGNWLTLKKQKAMAERSLDCDGHTMYKCPVQKAQKISFHMSEFYTNLPQRMRQYDTMAARENNKKSTKTVQQKGKKSKGPNRTTIQGGTMNLSTVHTTYTEEIEKYEEEVPENEDEMSISDEESGGSSSDDDTAPPEGGKSPKTSKNLKKMEELQLTRNPNPEDFLLRLLQALHSEEISNGAKARRIIECLEEAFNRTYIFARHLALAVRLFFKMGHRKATEWFGSYRVDLIVAVFARVVDIQNFELVMKELSPFEAACVYCRIGILSLYNPCKPEGGYELDLSRREERIVAKSLCLLATNEPGDNWLTQIFRWQRDMDPMPGWELTQPWLTDTGMPMRGLLCIDYYSGDCKNLRGCRPNVSYRKHLLHLVLIDEWELVEEGLRDKPLKTTFASSKVLEANRGMWLTYLLPKIDEKRKR